MRELAERLDIDLNEHGFAATHPLRPGETRQRGIYVAGVIEGPRDIPETVMSAASAAAMSSALLEEARGTLVHDKVYPEERDVAGEEPRVGVFVCRCGINIARVVDVPEAVEHAKTLPGVAFAEENLYTCSADAQQHIVNMIGEHKLNRLVVASCTPRTHEPLFRETCRDASLNKYLFEMANIRDQCSWVHADRPDLANEKAHDLIEMAVRRASTLEPLEERPYSVVKRALVIGGGLAGMTAALALGDAAFDVILVERAAELGGTLRHMRFDIEGVAPADHLRALVERLAAHPRVEVRTSTHLTDFSGHVGHFRTRLATPDGEQTVEHGAVIVATGAVTYEPQGEYCYGEDPRVLTQQEFEERFSAGEINVGSMGAGGVAMIQCVGSRHPDYPYCSRTCCTEAIRNAIKIKEASPKTPVYVIYRDIRTYGLREELYAQARRLGVLFIRYDLERKPEVTVADSALHVSVYDPILNRPVALRPDLLLLSVGKRPDPAAVDLSKLLKLPIGQDGFFLEAHMKLRPLDFASEGVFLCGLAHGPKAVDEIIAQARGAAGRAGTILSKERLYVSGQTSVVDGDHCAACLTCVRVCPYSAIDIRDEVAYIETASCHGCGACSAACPRKAITTRNISDRQVMAKLEGLVPKEAAAAAVTKEAQP